MPVKPGYQTTEFWKCAVVVIVGLLMMSGVIHVPDSGPWGTIVGGMSATLTTSLYAISRAAIKNAVAIAGTTASAAAAAAIDDATK